MILELGDIGISNKNIIIALILTLIFCLGGLLGINASEAATPKAEYYKAEACYRELRTDSQKRKYRHHWIRCIEKFQNVHQLDPSGPYAAAGLYMSAELYRELSKYSGKASDVREALDLYERIVNRFPKSGYRQKAERAMRKLSAQNSSQKTTIRKDTNKKKSSAAATDAAKDAYYSAETCYNELRNDSKIKKFRHHWLRCIEKFHAVYRHEPSGPWAAAGLYMTAKLYQELYKWSKNDADLDSARDTFEQVTVEFPDSRYRQKAAGILASLPDETQAASSAGTQDQREITEPKLMNNSTNGRVTVSGLRFWSNPNYTRVVIDTDRETAFSSHLLKKDPSINKPQRLYVDLSNSRLGKHIKKLYPIDDDLLSDARAGQNTPTSVRVVVDIKSFKTYEIFSLKDPFRIVIDLTGTGASQTAPKLPPVPLPDDGSKDPPGALARQLALGVSRIVIDPGHGGKDYGAPGYIKGVHEKNVVLALSKRLAKKIRQEIKCEVILTRSRDKYLTLEERTAFANTKSADLFISIHTNSHRNRRAYGIETYFLNLATDDEAIRVAAFENATSAKNISDLETILNDLMQNSKIHESSRLAVHTQSSLVNHLKKKKWSRIKDKGVKQAPFYVLLGAQMPSILIETSFISNPRECKRLTNAKYQDRLSEAIVMGIKKYIKEMTPTAFIQTSPKSRAGS
jgi:N-acetylmuramoyl-L-alanine amidase